MAMESGKSTGGSRTEPPSIDRTKLAADISAMAFRPIDPDRSLNIEHGLGGDEIVSIIERLCAKYQVDSSWVWKEIEFDRFFFRELDGCFPITVVAAWTVHLVRGRPPRANDAPFMVDDLCRMMTIARNAGD